MNFCSVLIISKRLYFYFHTLLTNFFFVWFSTSLQIWSDAFVSSNVWSLTNSGGSTRMPTHLLCQDVFSPKNSRFCKSINSKNIMNIVQVGNTRQFELYILQKQILHFPNQKPTAKSFVLPRCIVLAQVLLVGYFAFWISSIIIPQTNGIAEKQCAEWCLINISSPTSNASKLCGAKPLSSPTLAGAVMMLICAAVKRQLSWGHTTTGVYANTDLCTFFFFGVSIKDGAPRTHTHTVEYS